MDRDDAEKLASLRRLLPASDVAHGDLMLVGNALARQLAGVRANQAALEAARARRRRPRSKAAAERESEAKAAEALVTSIDGEIARLKMVPPAGKKDHVSVYGYVRRKGKGLAGARVELVDGDDSLACADTAADGRFTVEVTSAKALSLRVCERDTVVHRDDVPMHRAGPIPAYRIVEVDAKSQRQPPPASSGPGKPDGGTKPSRPKASRGTTRRKSKTARK